MLTTIYKLIMFQNVILIINQLGLYHTHDNQKQLINRIHKVGRYYSIRLIHSYVYLFKNKMSLIHSSLKSHKSLDQNGHYLATGCHGLHSQILLFVSILQSPSLSSMIMSKHQAIIDEPLDISLKRRLKDS